MILSRLHELAVRESLTADVAFEEHPVPYVVQIAKDGKYLGIEERRGTFTIESRKKGAPPKIQPDKGKVLVVPRPHGNAANQGFARFFVDTLPRVLPVSQEEKSIRSRSTFWEQIKRAADETNDPALRALQAFWAQLGGDPSLAERIRSDVEKLKPGVSDRCTFAWDPDLGLPIIARDPIKEWYRRFFQSVASVQQQKGAHGICQITKVIGPIPTAHPMRITIPGGLPTGVSIVSYDKPAFESYGLEGTVNAAIGCRAAEGYLRALTALIQRKLRDNPPTSLKVGETLFLFWTQKEADIGFMNLFDKPDTAQIERLFASVRSGQESHGLEDPNEFYLLGLSANAARAIVRDYLEVKLSKIMKSVAQWFQDLRIADISKEGVGKPTSTFPLWQLVIATALDMDQAGPETSQRLLMAALTGDPVPETLLIACLRRLRAEGCKGFRAARMALIKLILLRRDVSVTETLNPQEERPAYVCGQLLAVFETIQYAALGDVNANVVDKFFGTFSASPAMLLGRLCANAQNHLRKVRGEKPGTFVALSRLLMEVSGKLKAPPEGKLSLLEQGLFALGYYHQRAKGFEEAADRKAQAAAKTVASTV